MLVPLWYTFFSSFFFLTGQDPEQLFSSIDQDVQGALR